MHLLWVGRRRERDGERVPVLCVAGSSMQSVRAVSCVHGSSVALCVCVWRMAVSPQDTACGHLIRQRSTFLYLKSCPSDRYPECVCVY